MLATAAAFITSRYRRSILADTRLRNMVMQLLAISFILVSYVSFLGVLVNKAAPLE
jgi:head-tail adaptor